MVALVVAGLRAEDSAAPVIIWPGRVATPERTKLHAWFCIAASSPAKQPNPAGGVYHLQTKGELDMERWQLGTVVACIVIVWGATATSQQVQSMRGVVVTGRALTKDGWWMRVNTNRTRATRIDWQLRTPDGAPAARTWWYHSGHPAEVGVELPLRHENALRVQALTTPTDAPGSICVFWRQQGVALMEFTGSAERQLDARQTEPACVP